MPAYTGNVASSAGSTVNTIQPGVVTNAMLVTMTQNALKGAATSTAVADLAVPSCSAAGSALQWTTNTGFSCGTFSFQSAGWGLALSGGGVFSIATAQPPYGFDMPVNIGLTATVGGSALTINLTGANGSAPSATNPVSIPFRSTALATGTPVWATVTSALNIVIPSAATLGTTNSVPFRIWIFLAYNAGVPELVVATCSNTTTIFPCSAWQNTRKTTTTIDGFATSAGVPYSTAGVSNDALRIIGFADYGAGLATAGAYASTPTTLQLFGPGMPKPGDVIQTVAPNFGTLTVVTFTTVTSTNVTANITPTTTPNLVKYYLATTLANTNDGSTNTGQVFRGAGAIGAILKSNPATASGANSMTMVGLDAPGSVSAQTYVLKGTAVSGTGSIPAVNTDSATEILEEIMGALPETANDNIDPGVYSMTG